MFWSLGGILLFIGGWWFTGRLFGVYRKAIYLEEADRRRQELAQATPTRHSGVALFVIFDLGLLLLGIRSLSRLYQDLGGEAPTDSLALNAAQWSVVVCGFLFREGINLHSFYHDQWRARIGQMPAGIARPGTLRGLWHSTPASLRILLLLAPAVACVPAAFAFLGAPYSSFPFSEAGHLVVFVLWFATPQLLLALALASPLFRLRRLARASFNP